MEHDVSPRPFRLGARAHNPKGERAPVALCREPTEAAAETVGSNPAPATKESQELPCGVPEIFRFWADLSPRPPRF